MVKAKVTIWAETITMESAQIYNISKSFIGQQYLEINSPTKAQKESSMNRQFKERFETELTKTRDALT